MSSPNNNMKVLSGSFVDEYSQTMLNELFTDSWNITVPVEGLPLPVDQEALSILIDASKATLLAAVRKACGISLAQGQEVITKGAAELLP